MSPESDETAAESSLGPQVSGFNDFLTKMISRVALAYGTSEILSLSVEVEQALTELLSAYLGRDPKCVQYLSDHVVDQMTYEGKLTLLRLIIEESGWTADFPELMSTLHRVRVYRNQIAHSYADGDFRQQGVDGIFIRKSYRRGKEQTISLDSNELAEVVVEGGEIISSGLAEIFRRSVLPQTI